MINIDDLPESNRRAIIRAMEYWVGHWDWESPTLFGLSVEEFTAFTRTWPQSIVDKSSIAELVIVGAIRELLFGASSVPDADVSTTLGIDCNEAKDLVIELHRRFNQKKQP